jgi:hypothetical protein
MAVTLDDLLRDYLAANNLNDPAQVLAHLTHPSNKTLPLPIISEPYMISTRFFTNIIPNSRFCSYRWFGRAKLADIYDHIQEQLPQINHRGMRVIGNIGAGKSHILPTYVVYLHFLRLLNVANTPRVVYLSLFSDDTVRSIWSFVLSALKLTFPDHDFSTCPNNNDAAREWILNFINQQPVDSIVFIFDDWNFFEDHISGGTGTLESMREIAGKLCQMTFHQYRVEALSARSKSLSTRSARHHLPDFELYGGITDGEWLQWKASGQFPLFATLTDPQEEQELKYFTGLVPLLLTRLGTYGKASLKEAYSEFENDTVLGAGGQWMYSSLREFSMPYLDNEHHVDVDIYYSTMSAAIIGNKTPFSGLALYDRRFFFRDKDHVVKPIAGCISKMIVSIIGEIDYRHRRLIFQNNFNAKWVLSAFDGGNPSVKRFAFEHYCIRQLLQELGGYNKVKIVRFHGDFPDEQDIHDNELGTTVYWPYKWNLRFVDLVIRNVKNIPVSGATRSRSKGAKKQALSSSSKEVKIEAVQITFQTPQAHQDSLKFYTLKRGSLLVDAERYHCSGSDAHNHHSFLWILPPPLEEPMETSEFPVNPTMLEEQSYRIMNVPGVNWT